MNKDILKGKWNQLTILGYIPGIVHAVWVIAKY